MFCGKCGNRIKEDATFCVSCGAPVESKEKKGEIMDRSTNYTSNNKTTKLKTGNLKKVAIIAIMAILIIILVVILIRTSGCSWVNPLEVEVTNETVISVSYLEQQIVSIGELALVEYNYKTLITMQDSHKLGGWSIPLTQKSFIITVDGRIKIGIDASDIFVNVSENMKTISVVVPGAKILSHELFEETLVVMEESSGLFNPVSIEDWATMAIVEKQAMEEQVMASDVFTRAENDAVRMLQAFLGGVVPEEYTVNVTQR